MNEQGKVLARAEKQYRQGDVLLTPIPRGNVNISQAAEPRDDGKFVLATGEKTGHAHVIDAEKATLYDELFGGRVSRVLVVEETTELFHEEHEALTLEPGAYEVTLQETYEPPARGTKAASQPRPRWMDD